MAGSLKGQLLLAGRQLRDPNFFRSVVLMVEHDAQGAMGLVLNRPGQARVSGALGEERDDVPPIHDLLFEGGPVEPQALFVVHQIVRLRKGCTTVLPKVYLGGGQDAFEDFLSWPLPGLQRLLGLGARSTRPGTQTRRLDAAARHQ
jgi:putative transcriptional regulator